MNQTPEITEQQVAEFLKAKAAEHMHLSADTRKYFAISVNARALDGSPTVSLDWRCYDGVTHGNESATLTEAVENVVIEDRATRIRKEAAKYREMADNLEAQLAGVQS